MPSRLLDSLWITGYEEIPSGSVSFYQPATVVPIVVYSNDLATTVITQPVALDANGKSVVPIYVTQPARAIFKDVTGAQVLDVERIDGDRAELVNVTSANWPGNPSVLQVLDLLAGSLGGTNGNFLAGVPGAVPRTISAKLTETSVSVKDTGAVGNGIADDTGAAAAAISAVAGAGGGIVYFPPGTYLISGLLTIAGSNIILRGAGSGASIVKQATAATGVFAASGRANLTFEDLQVTASSPNTATGILLTNVSDVAVNRCDINAFQIGLDTPNSTASNRQLTILGGSITHTGIAASRCIRTSGTTALGNLTVMAARLKSANAGVGIGIEIGNTGTTPPTTLLGLDMQSVGSIGVRINSGTNLFGGFSGGCNFTGTSAVVQLNTSATSVPTWVDAGSYGFGYTDGTNGDRRGDFTRQPAGQTSRTATVAGAGTISPFSATDGYANSYVITANGNITVANGAIPGTGSLVTFSILNNTGGGITVTFGANYKTSAAVTPAAAATINLMFFCDGSFMREVGRQTA